MRLGPWVSSWLGLDLALGLVRGVVRLGLAAADWIQFRLAYVFPLFPGLTGVYVLLRKFY